MNVESKNNTAAPATCLARSVLEVLSREPTLEAVSINPAEQKISVATLGQTDVVRLSQQLTERLESARTAPPELRCALLEGASHCGG